MQQLTVYAQREHIDPVRAHETADGVSLIPYRSSPSQSNSFRPTIGAPVRCRLPCGRDQADQGPTRKRDVGMESATQVDQALPRRAVVRLLVEVVVAATEEDVDQVRPS